MDRKSKRKRRGMSIIETALILNVCLILIIIGFWETVYVVDDAYFRPNYITDDFDAVFSGVLFIGLALMIGYIATYFNLSGASERGIKRLFLFLIVMAPLWSIGLCIMQYQTIAQYKILQFGVCYSQSSHGKTYMYVENSDWCQRFGYTIARPSPSKEEQ